MKKIIDLNGIKLGSDKLFLIAGPCVIEDEKIMLDTAEYLINVSQKLNIDIIYKSSFIKDNRSSIKNYFGPGLEKGLKILEKIKKDFKFPIISDIHYPEQAKPASEILDIIQIPAYLSMQTTIIREAAKTGKILNIKHGQFLAPENMILPVNKAKSAGNDKIILTERGYTFGYNDLIVDPRSFYHLNETGYPVVFDITHSIRKYGIPSADPKGGAKHYLPTISRAGVAAGVNGLFIEVHPNPQNALCDAASQLCMTDLEKFLKPLLEIHDINVKYKNL